MTKAQWKLIGCVVLGATIFVIYALLKANAWPTSVADWFHTPQQGGGWVYEYQTLIGVAVALLAAFLTVHMMHREQRQQRKHFEKQMETLTRPDRLRVSRETALIIGQLRSVKESLERLGESDPSSVIARLGEALKQESFTKIEELLDDEFVDIVDHLRTSVQQTQSDAEAELSKICEQREDFGYAEVPQSQKTGVYASIIVKHALVSRIRALIHYFQKLRNAYGLLPF